MSNLFLLLFKNENVARVENIVRKLGQGTFCYYFDWGMILGLIFGNYILNKFILFEIVNFRNAAANICVTFFKLGK